MAALGALALRITKGMAKKKKKKKGKEKIMKKRKGKKKKERRQEKDRKVSQLDDRGAIQMQAGAKRKFQGHQIDGWGDLRATLFNIAPGHQN